MSKAVLSNRIFMEVTESQQAAIDKELTYSIPSYSESDPPVVIKNMGIIRPGLISFPIGRKDLIPTRYEIVDKRITAPTDFPKFKFELRASQQAVYDGLNDNAIINAWVSWGKTFTGLAIAGKLGQKTLVVTHTVPLRNQWAKETEKVFGFKPGIIGSGKFELDKPIVIGNTQTLYKNIPKIAREFGTIILDEMHHVSSPTFANIIDKSFARYKIGLSGTLERKDGKHVVFRDYFSDNIFKPPKENFMRPEIHLVSLDIRFLDGSSTPWALRINDLVNKQEYRESIALIAAKYAAEGHNVLLVSDRVHFLNTVAKLLGDKAVAITGEVSHEDRESLLLSVGAGTVKILCGTQAIFSEGISHNPLSCLILGTPVNNEPLLTQLIGRVARYVEGKRTPVIVDIQLKGNTAAKQANARLGHYIKQDYVIRKL